MTFAFPRRRAKQLIMPLIPEQWKAPLRSRLFGYRPSAVVLPVEFRGDDRRGVTIAAWSAADIRNSISAIVRLVAI